MFYREPAVQLTVMLRLQSSHPYQRLFALCILALSAAPTYGIDFGHWARHQREHRDWTSLDFRNPATGLFLAARAGTEDRRTHTTLTLTMAPAQGCEVDAVLVKKMDTPVSTATDTTVHVTIQMDGLAPQRLPARLITEPGDLFIFVQILNGLSFGKLKDHQVLSVTLPKGDSASFSLAGFENAWAVTEKVCKSFLLP